MGRAPQRQRVLGAEDLDDEALGDRPVAAEQVDGRVARRAVAERRRGQADGEALVRALGEQIAYAPQQPLVDRGDDPGALGDREEHGGEDELAVLVVHPQAELGELDRAGVEPRDGLAVDRKPALSSPRRRRVCQLRRFAARSRAARPDSAAAVPPRSASSSATPAEV